MDRPLIRAFRATVAYDGGGYAGSQIQPGERTVMGELNEALSKLCAHPVRTVAASRTDSGVHATGQVIGFRTSSDRSVHDIHRSLNGMLPGDVRITDCDEVDFEFHARFSSVGKMYQYRILRARELPPTLRKYVLFIEDHKPFDEEAVRRAAALLEGEHDFRSFSPRLVEGENPVKELFVVEFSKDEPLDVIRITGSGFLYQMVRRIVGTLIAIAQGREPEGAVADAIANPVTGSVKYNSKPKGLFLERVYYSIDEINEALTGSV